MFLQKILAGKQLSAGLPNIKGTTYGEGGNYYSTEWYNKNVYTGPFYAAGEHNNMGSGDTDFDNVKIYFDASRGETKADGVMLKGTTDYHVFGKSDTVQPAALVMKYIIRYL